MKLRIPFSEKNLSDFITKYILWLIVLPLWMLVLQTFEDFSFFPNFLLFWSAYIATYINPTYRNAKKIKVLMGKEKPSLYNAFFIFLLSVFVLFLGINVDRIFSGEELRHPRIYQILIMLEMSIAEHYGYYVHYLYQLAKELREDEDEEE